MNEEPYTFGVKLALADVSLFEKTATSRVLKELLKLSPRARSAAVQQLSPELRRTMSYKLLGRNSASAVKRLSDEGGHGAEHIFNVTRNAQALGANLPRAARERATLSSLLHDIGRNAEVGVRQRVGKATLKQQPESWHSETGGRYAKNFLRRNKEYAKNVPGLNRGQMSGAIRAHDTDAWGKFPWLKEQLARDPAAGTTYMADKLEGLGRAGAERTVSMAKKFKETPAQTNAVVQKNLQKYDRAINQFVPPDRMNVVRPMYGEYKNLMGEYVRTGALPSQRKAASLLKTSSSGNAIGRVLQLIGKESAATVVQRLKRVVQSDSSALAELLPAIYRMPMSQRMEILEAISKYGKGLL